MNLKMTQTKLLFGISLFFTLFFNISFFEKTFIIYPISGSRIFFLLSLSLVLTSFINILLNLIRSKHTTKPFLILLLFLSTLAAYVMDSYGTVLDDNMFLNIFNTDAHEAFDLVSLRLFIYLIFLWIIPSYIIYKIKLNRLTFKEEIFSRLKSVFASVLLIVILLFSFGKNYASFFREQKPLRYYTNPTYYIYSVGKYVSHFFVDSSTRMESLGLNAVVAGKGTKRELIIFVVGETARRDHFSLNGYKKETNPYLKKENVISFTNMTSCGTSTAVSVPCLFSNFGRNKFNNEKAATTENLLDILAHTKKVNILWRDNNSNSKGVALRVPYEDYKQPPQNTICDPECRDVGMLVGLQDYINLKKEGNIFIVLHQMGNHGPAYYKRYPLAFEKFKPVCQTNELEKCTNEEINNAYDNATFYTDFFLSKVIGLLKENSSNFGTSMFYVSDHGESLGEKGLYLHSLPYFMAPDEQKNIAAVLWFGGSLAKNTNYELLKKKAREPYSHDNIFHSFLGLMDIKTPEYNKELDIFDGVIHKN
ncbi:MAG: phosphoethanolamine--lipid A transferase [Bacteriovorax sp.]|nr:phosphoethanolamine--lipid A transferase [Bacteriovorax sp.]